MTPGPAMIRTVCKHSRGPFTWKEDDPSARIILESSFGLHAKTRLLGSTLNLVYMKFTCKILCSARLQSKMAGERDKKLVSGVLPYLLALITVFQHQFAIIYIQLDISNTATASYDSPCCSQNSSPGPCQVSRWWANWAS